VTGWDDQDTYSIDDLRIWDFFTITSPTIAVIGSYERWPETMEAACAHMGENFGGSLSEIKWWASAGTALGLYRDKSLLPWDTDIDFGIKGDWDKPEAITMALDGAFPLWERHTAITYKDRPMVFTVGDTTRGRPIVTEPDVMPNWLSRKGLIVDLYFYWEGLEPNTLVNFSKVGIYRKPAELVANPCRIVTPRYGTVPIPTPTDRYLDWRYGTDWHIRKVGNRGVYGEDAQTADE
jgi:hypothetical protein